MSPIRRSPTRVPLLLWLALAGGAVLVLGLVIGGLLRAGRAAALAALSRASTEARRTAARASLRQIGLGIAMYAADHGGYYPPDVHALLAAGYIRSADVFVDPADRALVVENGLRTSYVCIGAITIGERLPPNVIIAYTRKGVDPDGRSVVYLTERPDEPFMGHGTVRVEAAVEWVPEGLLTSPGDARSSLHGSYDAVMAAVGDWLDEQEKARLKQFYEVRD